LLNQFDAGNSTQVITPKIASGTGLAKLNENEAKN